jgi:beta-glucosidase
MKKKWLPIIITVAILTALGIVAYKVYDMMFNGSVTVQMTDVISAVKNCRLQLIVGGILLIGGFIAFIISRLIKEQRRKKIVTVQGCVSMIMALVITISWICLVPQYSNVNNVLAGNDSISKNHKQESLDISESIAEEGITLLKNENNTLPLSGTKKVNIFGWSSTNPVYGGGGSGSTSANGRVSLIQGIQDAGFETNKTIEDFYTAYRTDRPSISFMGVDFTVPEPTMDQYKEAGIFENAKAFSDTAIIVISRTSGEGGDLAMSLSDKNNFVNDEQGKPITFSSQEDDLDASKSYLELSNREAAMVKEVTSDFANVIVVVNSANMMELGWLNEYDSIKAAIWCPSPGETGFKALGKILSGEVNPSGHLVDTCVYDLLQTPTINNCGSFAYTNYEDVTGSKDNKAVFVDYNEGIYVGYKFYETAASEGLIDYDTVVQYPFGYGLSYTTFDAKIDNVKDDSKTISMDIKVTNTGNKDGKYVAEIFYNPPYTNGGIEKSTSNLVGFAKTDVIKAGATATVTVSFNYEDMASYDSEGIKANGGAYVLEAGDYQINLCSDSHTVLDTYVAKVAKDVVYNEENDGKRSTDLTAATNQFPDSKGNVTYLSRANHFENYSTAIQGPTEFEMTDEIKKNYASVETFDASEYDDANAVMPTTGVNHGLTIQDMKGLDFSDAKWDQLLEELTVDQLEQLVADGTYHAIEIDSINLPYVKDTDGPSGVNSFFTGKSGTGFTAPILLAASWNVNLASDMGKGIAQELNDFGFTGWYGPGMDIHRTAFSGRNFEYYSEDGVLSGKMAASEVKAAREQGIITYVKHFALNDSETDRAKGICTWATEQSIREIYLKPFEMAVKEGGSDGVMNSKNAIGSEWVGASKELMTNVLRKEWGFEGCVMTDALDTVSTYYQNPDEAVRAGTDKMMPASMEGEYWDNESAGTVTALRNAAHHYLYALANSNAMDISTGTPGWVIVLWSADIAIALLLAAWEVITFRHLPDKKKIVKNDANKKETE